MAELQDNIVIKCISELLDLLEFAKQCWGYERNWTFSINSFVCYFSNMVEDLSCSRTHQQGVTTNHSENGRGQKTCAPSKTSGSMFMELHDSNP